MRTISLRSAQVHSFCQAFFGMMTINNNDSSNPDSVKCNEILRLCMGLEKCFAFRGFKSSSGAPDGGAESLSIVEERNLVMCELEDCTGESALLFAVPVLIELGTRAEEAEEEDEEVNIEIETVESDSEDDLPNHDNNKNNNNNNNNSSNPIISDPALPLKISSLHNDKAYALADSRRLTVWLGGDHPGRGTKKGLSNAEAKHLSKVCSERRFFGYSGFPGEGMDVKIIKSGGGDKNAEAEFLCNLFDDRSAFVGGSFNFEEYKTSMVRATGRGGGNNDAMQQQYGGRSGYGANSRGVFGGGGPPPSFQYATTRPPPM